jgi:hypothetical protein
LINISVKTMHVIAEKATQPSVNMLGNHLVTSHVMSASVAICRMSIVTLFL